MKKQLLLSILILTLGLSAFAQKAPKQSKTEKNLRKHVSYLASDELEGRRTGEKGATYAAGYVSNMFQRFKLKAGYKDSEGRSSYLQPFDYVSGIEFGATSAMSFEGRSLTMREDWTPYVYSSGVKLPATDIVFAFHGISSPRLGHDDYEGIDANGKIVAAFAGTPDDGGPHSPLSSFNVHAKANVAKQKGAVALIIIAADESLKNERRTSMSFNQTLGETAVPVVIVSREIGGNILGLADSKELTEAEEWLASKPESAAVRFSKLKPRSTSINIEINKIRTEAYNVIGVIEGRDKTLKNEAIVIGAHYDHLGHGGEGSLAPNSNEVHNGADDNASGTSALIELAQKIRKQKKNKRTMIFIAFGGEEEGLLGSKAYVNNPVFPIEDTVAMFNMDMVGRLKDQKLTVGGIGTAGLWNDTVTGLNKRIVKGSKNPTASKSAFSKAKEEVEIFNLQLNQDGFGPSDHSSFYAAKVPVLFFFTGTHSDYHKPTDDADKINYSGLEEISGFVASIVRIVDQNPTRPVYKTATPAATQGGRRGFNVSLGTIPGYGDSDNTGLLLEGVRDDSPAAKAGIKGGDKLVMLAGKEIRNITDYVYMLGELKAGEEYELVVERDGEKIKLKIVPDPRN